MSGTPALPEKGARVMNGLDGRKGRVKEPGEVCTVTWDDGSQTFVSLLHLYVIKDDEAAQS